MGRKIYFFIQSLGTDNTPETYVRRKYDFIQSEFPNGDPILFFLAWNGLIQNDSFTRVMEEKFNLNPFKNKISSQHVPPPYLKNRRYRMKDALGQNMANDGNDGRRFSGRELLDYSGRTSREKLIWLPNGKCVPIHPDGLIPQNETHITLIRHGKAIYESGGDNPLFVGSGNMDSCKNNKIISGNISNYLSGEGFEAARELGLDFKVAADILEREGCPLWVKDNPIKIFGSESVNTEETITTFMQSAGFHNLSFKAISGLNSQKYGAVTHKNKKEVIKKVMEIYGISKEEVKARFFKNRFFCFPEGESLIESDWRIGNAFVNLFQNNLGERIAVCDHSGAIRVLQAIIQRRDFADYATLKERQDAILALAYKQGRNVRYDAWQRVDYPLREREAA